MTVDDVINAAKEGWYEHTDTEFPEKLMRTSMQVSAMIEREECARICDSFQERLMQPAECAGAIRMRGRRYEDQNR